MGRKPLVSVIIIFLNEQRFIEEAIESVFAQTYKNWELLLVDDGSTDGSTEIAKQYAAEYPNLIYYLRHDGHQNRGMSASRNLGIARARGEFIAFLDADDIWIPDKVEEQVTVMCRHPDIGLVVTPAFYWYENGVKKAQPMTLAPGIIPIGGWLPRLIESNHNAACPSAVLIRRELALRVGGFEEAFRGSLMVVEDQVMWFKITMNAPIYYHPVCLTLYRVHLASCSRSTPSLQRLMARARLYSWLAEFLKNSNSGRPTPRIFSLMAEYSLCSALLRASIQTSGGTPDRIDVGLEAGGTDSYAPGTVPFRLLRVGRVFPWAAWVLATAMAMVTVCIGINYTENIFNGVRTCGRYVIRAARHLRVHGRFSVEYDGRVPI